MEEAPQSFNYFQYRKIMRILAWLVVITGIIIVLILYSYKKEIQNCELNNRVAIPDGSLKGFTCISKEEYKTLYDNTNNINLYPGWGIDKVS